jgi:plasmid stabilization system protein ParE
VTQFQILFSPAAEQDLAVGYDWHLQYSQAAANAWRLRIIEAIDYVGRSPMSQKIWVNELRRWHVRRTRYSIIYRVREDIVTIAAVAHERMRPENWQSR